MVHQNSVELKGYKPDLPGGLVYAARAHMKADAKPRDADAPQAAAVFRLAVACLSEAGLATEVSRIADPPELERHMFQEEAWRQEQEKRDTALEAEEALPGLQASVQPRLRE